MTKRDIRKALENLGDDPDLVASNLYANGFKGNAKCHTCPVAHYLIEYFGESHVAVFPTCVWIKDVVGGSGVVPPDAVIGFIRQFDNGGYPELYRKNG